MDAAARAAGRRRSRRARRGPAAIVVVADHGEGLGDHGEAQHGNLALPVDDARAAGAGRVRASRRASCDAPVSTRRVFHTLLDWAGLGAGAQPARAGRGRGRARRGDEAVPVVRLAAAGDGGRGAAQDDPRRAASRPTTSSPTRARRGTSAQAAAPSRPLRDALRDYPMPSLAAAPARRRSTTRTRAAAGEPRLRRAPGAAPVVRAGRAAAGGHDAALRRCIDEASGLFVREEYAAGDPAARSGSSREDPRNLDAALRLATAHSSLGHGGRGGGRVRAGRARSPPTRPTCASTCALHYARGRAVAARRAAARARRAGVARPAARARGAGVGARARRAASPEALALRQRIYALRPPGAGRAACGSGELAMAAQQTRGRARGLRAGARGATGTAFAHDLELGVLYLAARRLPEARDALDRVPALASRVPDGALQARAGERAAARARCGGAHRGGARARGRDDAPADRARAAVRGPLKARKARRVARRAPERALRLEQEARRQLEAPRVEVEPRRARTPSCSDRGSML